MALTVTGVLVVSLEDEKNKGSHDKKETCDSQDDSQDNDMVVDAAQGETSVEDTSIVATSNSIRAVVDEAIGDTIEGGHAGADNGKDTIESTSGQMGPPERDSHEPAEKSTNDHDSDNNLPRRRVLTLVSSSSRRGYALAFVNVGLDTYGSLLTKEHGVGMTTWEINLIRFGFSGACMLALSVVMIVREKVISRRGHHDDTKLPSATARDEDIDSLSLQDCETLGNQDLPSTSDPTSDDELDKSHGEKWYSLPRNMTRNAWLKVSMGVAFVTFATPALFNYSLFQIALALALTLSSVGPLYALPLTWLLQHDRPTVRACFGGILAVAGIVVLSFLGKEQSA